VSDRGIHYPHFFFVIVDDLLQTITNEAWQRCDIQLPLDNDFGQKYLIIQYGDDTLLIMHADPN
jgi:hypothetical protein